MKKPVSEFRQDMVSGDWILVASRRGRRPNVFDHKKGSSWKNISKRNCPFDNPQKKGNPYPVLWYGLDCLKPGVKKPEFKNWFVQIIPNKFPALSPSRVCPSMISHNHYNFFNGVGFHDVIITRPHDRSLGEMSHKEAELVLCAYQNRYLHLKKEKCVEYILIFHNHGEGAGASIAHPHSQLIAMPIVPPDVSRSFAGSERYFKKCGHCVHCTMLEWELSKKSRIVFQNEYFVVLAPFASRVSFELRIYPKWHASHFEELDEHKRIWLAEALVEALRRLDKALDGPDYNFFIHTAPAKVKYMEHYHWHFEILPKTGVWAGLEFGTGVEVVSVPPEEAAKMLRAAKK